MRGLGHGLIVLIVGTIALALYALFSVVPTGNVQASHDLDQKTYLPVAMLDYWVLPDYAELIPCSNAVESYTPGVSSAYCIDETFSIHRINLSYTQVRVFLNSSYQSASGHYGIQVNAQLDDSISDHGDAYYGLWFGTYIDEDFGGTCVFAVDPRDGTYVLRYKDGAEWAPPIVDWTFSPHVRRDFEVNRLRWEVDGQTLILAVNGEVLVRIEDPPCRDWGWGGLYARNAVEGTIIHYDHMLHLKW